MLYLNSVEMIPGLGVGVGALLREHRWNFSWRSFENLVLFIIVLVQLNTIYDLECMYSGKITKTLDITVDNEKHLKRSKGRFSFETSV